MLLTLASTNYRNPFVFRHQIVNILEPGLFICQKYTIHSHIILFLYVIIRTRCVVWFCLFGGSRVRIHSTQSQIFVTFMIQYVTIGATSTLSLSVPTMPTSYADHPLTHYQNLNTRNISTSLFIIIGFNMYVLVGQIRPRKRKSIYLNKAVH